jgi:hypothetical protein
MTPGRTVGSIIAGAALATGTLCIPSAVHADDENARMKHLVEKIACGDEVEAAAASEQLIELVTGPLADAIGSLEARPAEEQVRLRNVMARLAGALRMRVFRADLPAEDRRLFDGFSAAYAELVQRLFDDNYRVRMAAVLQIPLEPDTGAGVLIAAKVNDEDEDVAKAALTVAAKLHDAAVARNLTRYVHDATATIAAGFYGPAQQDIARTVALLVWESIRIIGEAGCTESVPTLADALRFFGRSTYWDHYQRSEAMRVLGRLEDARAAPLLLEFLDDATLLRVQTDREGQRVSETVGDVALLSLLRIYKLKPQDFGLRIASPQEDFGGYASEEARHEGHRAFRIWHQRHAGSAAVGVPGATSQPTGQENN